jgi:hypothetical protein
VPLDVIEKAPFSPLALSAGHFFQAFKHFDQFAGKGGVFIRGGGRLVELAAEVDGIDMSLVIPNPLELQRDTTPFCKLFPGKGDGEPVRLEAAE